MTEAKPITPALPTLGFSIGAPPILKADVFLPSGILFVNGDSFRCRQHMMCPVERANEMSP